LLNDLLDSACLTLKDGAKVSAGSPHGRSPRCGTDVAAPGREANPNFVSGPAGGYAPASPSQRRDVARPTHLTGGLPVLPRPRQVRRPGARPGAAARHQPAFLRAP